MREDSCPIVTDLWRVLASFRNPVSIVHSPQYILDLQTTDLVVPNVDTSGIVMLGRVAQTNYEAIKRAWMNE